jgi:hypothetical protein
MIKRRAEVIGSKGGSAKSRQHAVAFLDKQIETLKSRLGK